MYPSSTPGLPSPGANANNWGSILNDYLLRSLVGATSSGDVSGGAVTNAGQLLTSPNNPYTGLANTNLATGSQPGLVQLAGDLSNTYASPTVVGIQGNAVASTGPSNGNVLTWSSGSSQWQPSAPSSGSGPIDIDGGSSSSVYGGVTAIDCGTSL